MGARATRMSDSERDWYAAYMNARTVEEHRLSLVTDEIYEPQWYVAYTNIKSEKRAAEGLQRKGFDTFLPMMSRWTSRRHKRVLREQPLFPRYLFVDVRGGSSTFALRATDGIEALLVNDGKPLVVPAKLIAEIRAEHDAGVYCEQEPRAMSVGMKVKIAQGPFEGRTGVCQLVSGSRAEILIEMLTRAVLVKIGVDELISVI